MREACESAPKRDPPLWGHKQLKIFSKCLAPRVQQEPGGDGPPLPYPPPP